MNESSWMDVDLYLIFKLDGILCWMWGLQVQMKHEQGCKNHSLIHSTYPCSARYYRQGSGFILTSISEIRVLKQVYNATRLSCYYLQGHAKPPNTYTSFPSQWRFIYFLCFSSIMVNTFDQTLMKWHSEPNCMELHKPQAYNWWTILNNGVPEMWQLQSRGWDCEWTLLFHCSLFIQWSRVWDRAAAAHIWL